MENEQMLSACFVALDMWMYDDKCYCARDVT